MTSLLVLLAPEPGVGVGHPDAELLGPLDQGLAVLGGHAVGDLGTELLVLHHQDLELLQGEMKAGDQTRGKRQGGYIGTFSSIAFYCRVQALAKSRV